MNIQGLKISLIVLSGFLVLLFLCELVTFVVYWVIVMNHGIGNVNDIEARSYQILQLSDESNLISVGMVRIFDEIEDNDFVFSQIEDGTYTLVSNIGDTEYKCTGACYCDKEDRRNAGAIKIGVTYLLVAVTSMFAYNLAQDYFITECQNLLRSECSQSTKGSIRSEIEGCSPALESTNLESEHAEGQLVPAKKFSAGDSQYDFVRYWCEGACVPRERTFGEAFQSLKFDTEESYNLAKKKCESIEQKSQVFVPATEDPQLFYQRVVLEPTCIEASKFELYKQFEQKFDREVAARMVSAYESVDPRVWCPCSGGWGSGLSMLNPSVKCRKTGK